MELLRWGPEALRHGFATVPRTVMYDGTLALGPKVLYGVIAGHLWGSSSVAWPSQARLAECCGVNSRETIRKWTRELEDRGLLTTDQRKDGSLVYTLWVPTSCPSREGTPCPFSEGTPAHSGRGPSPLEMGTEVQEGKYKKGKRLSVPSKLGTEGLVDELLELRKTASREDLSLIDEYLELAAAENKSGTITMGRRLNETRELLELQETLGAEAWRHGMRVALKAEAPNANYVKKVGQKYDPEKERKRERNSDPDKISDAEWQRIQLHRQSLIAQGLDPDGEEEY